MWTFYNKVYQLVFSTINETFQKRALDKYHSGGLCEYEYDHVFVGEYNGSYKPDPEEILSKVVFNCST